MKKILCACTIICSLLMNQFFCQNKFDQNTHPVIDNATKLKKRIDLLQSEQHYQTNFLTPEQLQTILIAQDLLEGSPVVEKINTRKTAHQNLENIITWLEQLTTVDDWINYFALHNQMIGIISTELESLKDCSEICNKIRQRIVKVFAQGLNNLFLEAENSENFTSLLCAYQDYQKLFANQTATIPC